MFRYILLLSILLKTSPASTQNWFPEGATWYYNQVILLQGNFFRRFDVAGDTTIQGKFCKRITGSCNCSMYGGVNYLHQNGDRIFVYVPAVNSFRLLYDFGRIPGDTLTMYGGNFGEALFLIDSITSFSAGSQTLRIQHIRSLNRSYGLGTKIYERIGSDGCLFPDVSFCDPSTGGLRCYEDAELGLVKFYMPLLPCNYVTSATHETYDAALLAYPNPADHRLHVESSQTISAITLTHLSTGRVVATATLSQNVADIETEHLPPGTYLLQVAGSAGKIECRKVVILR
jgi:Secretion system C-terminal sorting domain